MLYAAVCGGVTLEKGTLQVLAGVQSAGKNPPV